MCLEFTNNIAKNANYKPHNRSKDVCLMFILT